MRNRGNSTWLLSGNYSLKVNTDACGLFVNPPQMLDIVGPNKNTSMLAYITAPGTLGPCAIELQMTETPGGGSFGAKLNLIVNVIARPNDARDWRLGDI